ncbi:uncharacterized protein KY384_006575 [Bacidia gigantensis]|uniref:uncharacterized protein n=1 Tax=Bacidia gigantensis TaxID=2732470 RepID=UPI001D04A198|nr:uncharacterized protein KY384_006575 [Bacidia gigantensis]KAG8528886.1 hypothetical protein KY384_006575 [Bacidia gigantensis]
MDKIKNILSPGHAKDDEVLYGSGRIDDPVLANKNKVAGEGSHFPDQAPSEDLLGRASKPSTVEQTTGLREPPPSRMPGAFDDDDTATTTSVKSGIPGTTPHENRKHVLEDVESQKGNESTTSDPFVGAGATSGHISKPKETYEPEAHSGGNKYADATAGPHAPTSTKSREPETYPGTSTSTGATPGSYISAPLKTNEPDVHPGRDKSVDLGISPVPATAGETKAQSSSTMAPTSLSGATDHPSAGSEPPITSNTRDASSLGIAPVGGGGHPASNITDSTGGRSFPLGGHSAPSSQYTAPGQVGTYPAGGIAPLHDSHTTSSAKGNPLAHTTGGSSSITPEDSNTGALGVGASSLGSSGPETQSIDPSDHHRNTYLGARTEAVLHSDEPHDSANCATGTGTSLPYPGSMKGTSASSPLGSSSNKTDAVGTPSHHSGQDAFLAGGLGATAGATYGTARDPSSSSTGPAPTTAGPHKSDALNKVDPRVDSDLSKERGDANTIIGSSQTSSTTPISQPYSTTSSQPLTGAGRNETDRHAGPVGTAIGGGVVDHERSRQHEATPSSTTAAPESTGKSTSNFGLASTTSAGSSSTAGPHSADLANKADPRVDSDLDGRSGLGDGVAGSGYGSKSAGYQHPARDAGLVGAAGAGAYGAERGHDSHAATDPDRPLDSNQKSTTPPSAGQGGVASSMKQPTSTNTSSNAYQGLPEDHSHRDTAIGAGAGAGIGAGAAGLAAHEYSKHEPMGSEAIQQPGSDLGAISSTPTASPHTATTDPRTADTSYGHTARDTGVTTVGGASTTQPTLHDKSTKDQSSTVAATSATGLATHDYQKRDALPSNTTTSEAQPVKSADEHTGRNAALGAGAGAGAAGLAAYEYNEKEAKAAEKAHQQDVKHAEKEHQKEVKHAEKEHQKEIKQAEKDAKKHENQDSGEKKPGLIDRILHRHHDDKEEAPKKEKAPLNDVDTGKGVIPSNPKEREREAAAEGLTRREGETGDSSSLGNQSYRGPGEPHEGTAKTTHDAYDTTEGHNKLHKEPPTKVLKEHGLQ